VNILKRLKPGWGLVPIIVFLAFWEVVARLNVLTGTFMLPPFSEVLIEFYDLSASGVLGENFLSSLRRVLIGFCAGSITGIIIGTIMGWNKIIDKSLNPLISLFYPIPTLGWIPLLMIWIGINEMLPITLIFICSFFPVLYNTVTGIKNVDRDYVRAARTLGASDMQVLTTIIVPLALPNIFTGLRLEAGMAWRVIIAAEMVAIPSGIGFLLMRGESLIRVDIIIVCLIVLAIMSLTFEKFFEYLENKITARWRQNAIHYDKKY
jgi:NitT/TauT family transport system permease protein